MSRKWGVLGHTSWSCERLIHFRLAIPALCQSYICYPSSFSSLPFVFIPATNLNPHTKHFKTTFHFQTTLTNMSSNSTPQAGGNYLDQAANTVSNAVNYVSESVQGAVC